MTVLIADANKGYFLGFNPKIKFKKSSTNTSTFLVSHRKFKALYIFVEESGNNPFNLMYW